MPGSNPSFGPASVAGFSTSAVAFASAAAAFLFTHDRSEQTVGTIVAGAVGALTLAVTIGGRMAQAALTSYGTGVPPAFQPTMPGAVLAGSGVTTTSPSPSVAWTNTDPDLDPDPPKPFSGIADPRLDDPGTETLEQHSDLDG
jgi:hypothetical protein